jgi:hypothetical protein
MGIASGCAAPVTPAVPTPPAASKTRLSWSEVLALAQQAISAQDSAATLDSIHAAVAFDEKHALDSAYPTVPFPLNHTSFYFLNSAQERLRIEHMDTFITDSLHVFNDGVPTYVMPVSATISLKQLPEMIKVGPMEACLSTLDLAQELTGAKRAGMYCLARVQPYGPDSNKYGLPAVWSVSWIVNAKKKDEHTVYIWLDAATGERLRVRKDQAEVTPIP